jgi:hypothetical protein
MIINKTVTGREQNGIDDQETVIGRGQNSQ